MFPEKILIKKMRLKETVPPIFRVMLVALITSTLAMIPGCSGKKLEIQFKPRNLLVSKRKRKITFPGNFS